MLRPVKDDADVDQRVNAQRECRASPGGYRKAIGTSNITVRGELASSFKKRIQRSKISAK